MQPNRPTEIPLAGASGPHLPTPLPPTLCFSSLLFPLVGSGPAKPKTQVWFWVERKSRRKHCLLRQGCHSQLQCPRLDPDLVRLLGLASSHMWLRPLAASLPSSSVLPDGAVDMNSQLISPFPHLLSFAIIDLFGSDLFPV